MAQALEPTPLHGVWDTGGGGAARTLREVSLETPIRYGAEDPVEAWLYSLLCLDTKV